MKPLKLTLQGIYSYRDKYVVDFEALTEAGLFEIFGPTGSGKSTILEAISFALYGKTERLGEQYRNYNMMNLRSKEMFIENELPRRKHSGVSKCILFREKAFVNYVAS